MMVMASACSLNKKHNVAPVDSLMAATAVARISALGHNTDAPSPSLLSH